jgi:hypothetical protein
MSTTDNQRQTDAERTMALQPEAPAPGTAPAQDKPRPAVSAARTLLEPRE